MDEMQKWLFPGKLLSHLINQAIISDDYDPAMTEYHHLLSEARFCLWPLITLVQSLWKNELILCKVHENETYEKPIPTWTVD